MIWSNIQIASVIPGREDLIGRKISEISESLSIPPPLHLVKEKEEKRTTPKIINIFFILLLLKLFLVLLFGNTLII